jgi:hypothetical protein
MPAGKQRSAAVLPAWIQMHENLIAYRVELSSTDTPASTSYLPQFLAIVRAANLVSAHREAERW